MSMLRTINTLMSIGAKAHYMNGGNVKKADPMAKPQYTLKKVAELTGFDYDELKDACVQNGVITSGGYILNNNFGRGEKFNDYFVQSLLDNNNQDEKVNNNIDAEKVIKQWNNKFLRAFCHIMTVISILFLIASNDIISYVMIFMCGMAQYAMYLSKHNPSKFIELMKKGNK